MLGSDGGMIGMHGASPGNMKTIGCVLTCTSGSAKMYYNVGPETYMVVSNECLLYCRFHYVII